MSAEALLNQNEYNPNRLLDSLIERFHLKNDAALSRALEVTPPVISKIRHNKLPIGASPLIRMHEFSEMSIAELRTLMGDRRGQYRISDKYPDKRRLAGQNPVPSSVSGNVGNTGSSNNNNIS